MMNLKKKAAVTDVAVLALLLTLTMAAVPEVVHASLESTLYDIRHKLTGIIMPAFSVIGVCLACFSFYTGNENAKRHLGYAVIGCLLGFGAQMFVDFLAGTVH